MMHTSENMTQVMELNAQEIELVSGGPLPAIPIIVAGAKAALASSTGKAIAAGAFVAAVTVASAVMDD